MILSISQCDTDGMRVWNMNNYLILIRAIPSDPKIEFLELLTPPPHTHIHTHTSTNHKAITRRCKQLCGATCAKKLGNSTLAWELATFSSVILTFGRRAIISPDNIFTEHRVCDIQQTVGFTAAEWRKNWNDIWKNCVQNVFFPDNFLPRF